MGGKALETRLQAYDEALLGPGDIEEGQPGNQSRPAPESSDNGVDAQKNAALRGVGAWAET